MEDFDAFARLVTALRPWLGQLMVVGGWAHRLHRFHPLANQPGHLPLRTRDTDLAFSPDEALAGDVRKALTDDGFTEELFGDDAPPATEVTDTIREAARIPQDRRLTPENVRRACAYGFGEVFGTVEGH